MEEKNQGVAAPQAAAPEEYRCDVEACGVSVWSRCGLAIYGTCRACGVGMMRRVVFPDGWAERMKRAKAAEDEDEK